MQLPIQWIFKSEQNTEWMEKGQSGWSVETWRRLNIKEKLQTLLFTIHPLQAVWANGHGTHGINCWRTIHPRPGRIRSRSFNLWPTPESYTIHRRWVWRKQITGTVFVDLKAAYDTVNHKTLLLKVAKLINNKKIFYIIQSLLENRRFFVDLDERKIRWHN